MTPLDETAGVEANGELGHEEVSEVQSIVGTGGGDPIGKGRVRGSPAEAIISDYGSMEVNGKMIEGESHSNLTGSPSSSGAEGAALTSSAAKGFGLKKWRRIRRDINKDGNFGTDSVVFHKRRLPLAEQKTSDSNRNPSDDEGDGQGKVSATSVESTNRVSATIVVSPSPPKSLDQELKNLAAIGFAIGIDSENSEDQGGKSSAAASAPRLRHETGFGRERRGIRSVGGRGSGHIIQHKGHHARGGNDANKKTMGHQAKIEKETSTLSVESDLRSSNSVSDGVVSNGKKTESVNYDMECSDVQPTEDVQSYHSKVNCGLKDFSRENPNAEILNEQNVNQSENSHSESYVDPFSESITSLQAAQEALEKEIQNFEEIGKETMLDASDDEESSSELEEKELYNKLQGTLETVKAKESKIHELQVNLSVARNKELEAVTLCSLQQSRKELEVELDNLMENNIAAKIEYLVITSSKFLQEHTTLREQQKIRTQDLMKMQQTLQDAENKIVMLKARKDELEHAAQDVLMLQSGISKYCLCCFVQIVILSIAFGLFVLRIMPSSRDFVPT